MAASASLPTPGRERTLFRLFGHCAKVPPRKLAVGENSVMRKILVAGVARVGAVLLAIASQAQVAQAENLNRKYGPSWSCSNIDARFEQLYQACRACETQGMDFDQV